MKSKSSDCERKRSTNAGYSECTLEIKDQQFKILTHTSTTISNLIGTVNQESTIDTHTNKMWFNHNSKRQSSETQGKSKEDEKKDLQNKS